jgi:hypothetical protein
MNTDAILEWVEILPGCNPDGTPVNVVVTMRASAKDCIAMQRYEAKQCGARIDREDKEYLSEFMPIKWASVAIPNSMSQQEARKDNNEEDE